ncbi:hypothetical protein J2X50_001672 [Aminobacter sp. BE322]
MTARDFVVRGLVPGEGAALRKLRLAALANAPYAFISTVEDEAELTDADFDARLASPEPDATFGVVANGEIVGMARLAAERRAKVRHEASMRSAMSIRPGAGRGRHARWCRPSSTMAGRTG